MTVRAHIRSQAIRDLPAASLQRLDIPVLYTLAFFSGAAALLYQVVWVHMLTLTFGSTTVGASVVIAAFMGGLGIGARHYERLKSRISDPLRLYAAIEAAIAVIALGISLNLDQLPPLYAALAGPVGSAWALNTIRIVSAFTVLFIPAYLIGATFPALCTAIIQSMQGVNRHLGGVYGINTLGAAVGTVLAGFLFIERFGNLTTIWIAAGINAAIGLTAYLTRVTLRPPLPRTAITTEANHPSPVSWYSPKLIALVLGISGFVTLSFEIIWMRGVRYLVGNSTYAMTLVLAVFLLSLGLGGLLHRPTVKRFHAEAILIASLVLSGLFALVSVGLLSAILSNGTLAANVSIFSDSVRFLPWGKRLLLTSTAATVLLLPSTISMGLTFPLASALMVDRVTILGRRIGSAYLVSTIGSIVGVLVAALLLLPQLGIVGSVKVTAGVSLIGGAGLLIVAWRRVRGARIGFIAPLVLSGTLMIVFPAHLVFRGEQEEIADHRLVFWEEGEQATVKVIERADAGGMAMTVDGYLIGVDQAWRREAAYKQLVLAHLPMALNPDARHTLNIGLGSATTLASLGRYPSIQSLDCVEISKAVANGARVFADGAVLDDPRTHLIVDDAVHYLLKTDTRYDVIISDGKQNPQFPGNSLMLATDFYELALGRLTHDGVFVQWIPANLPERAFEIALRSFVDAFPYTSAYFYPPSCLILAGMKHAPSLPGTDDLLNRPLPEWATQELAPYHIASRAQLLAAQSVDDHALRQAIGDGLANTWDHPFLEFIPYKEWMPDDNRVYAFHNIGRLVTAGLASPNPFDDDAHPVLKRAAASASLMRAGFLEAMRTFDPAVLKPYCEYALKVNPADSLASGYLRKIPQGIRAVFIPGQ